MSMKDIVKLASQNKPWFEVRAASEDNDAEVLIYDEIGESFWGGGVSPKSLIDEIDKLKLKASETLTVRINSPGGNFFDGNTIYNYLRSMKNEIKVVVDGVAASAASIIAMAGDKVVMPENAFLFIHNPWMIAAGDANVMRKAADDLDKLRDSAVSTYSRRAPDVDKEEMHNMLDQETWLDAQTAVDLGFADEMLGPVKVAALARFDFDKLFDSVPEQITNSRQSARISIAERRKEFAGLVSATR